MKKTYDLVTLGEILIDMFPDQIGGRIAEVEKFIPKPGGAPANVAVAASRLGGETAFIGKVGQDHFGTYLIDVLAGEGVDTRGVCFDPEARTTMAIIAMPDANTAEFVFYRNPGADQRLQVSDLDESLLASTRAFHFGSVSLTDEPARSATLAAARTAREAGALVSFDVNYRPSLWKDPELALEQTRKMLPEVDLVKVNETEAALLTGMDQLTPGNLDRLEASTRRLLEQGPAAAVLTLGPRGSYFQTGRAGGYVPPYQVETVDSVGCGDAFVAGLLTQLGSTQKILADMEEEDFFRALGFANAVGALTSLKRGVIPALPTLAEVETFLSKQK